MGTDVHARSPQELQALYLSVAESLGRSAQLAEKHGRRLEREGLSGEHELELAQRALDGAARASARARLIEAREADRSSLRDEAEKGARRDHQHTMIEKLTDMPPDTIGFRVAGEVEREDYTDVLTPELERALEAGALRTLYVIESLDEMEPGAVWADAKLGLDMAVRRRDAWVRSAIVTDIEWLARATKLFAWMIPGEVRVFPLAELEPAKSWITEG
jgi:hypothetical protein